MLTLKIRVVSDCQDKEGKESEQRNPFMVGGREGKRGSLVLEILPWRGWWEVQVSKRQPKSLTWSLGVWKRKTPVEDTHLVQEIPVATREQSGVLCFHSR